MENPIKMDDLGASLFLETPIWSIEREHFGRQWKTDIAGSELNMIKICTKYIDHSLQPTSRLMQRYPQARPVEPLFNRLRSEGGPRLWSHQRVRPEIGCHGGNPLMEGIR